jgi:5-formyltetrahydrofolate cyclo-ligase
MPQHHDSAAPDKRAWRAQMRERRLLLSEEERYAAAAELALVAERSGVVRRFRGIAGYVPQGGEIDIMPLLSLALAQGCALSLPCCEEDGTLRFRRWEWGEALIPGRHDIPAPHPSRAAVIPELVLLPLLACDARGVRLGSGGGYYDRTLAQPAYAESIRLGVGYAFQAIARLPDAPHDVRVHALLTEAGIREFG